jgi:hypothetical protein
MQSPAQISVNGKDATVAAEPRSFAAIRRVWRNNDTIQVTLPFLLRQEPIDGHRPNTVAVLRGPVMLVALDPQMKIDANQLKTLGGSSVDSHAGGALQLKAVHTDVQFVPFYTVGEQSYTTYLELA